MALSLLDRIKEGIGTISDYAKATQTEAKTRELQRELEKRRAKETEQPESVTTGNIFQDISREVRTALQGVQAIQLQQREPARFEPRKASEETKTAIKEQPILGFPIRRFEESQKATEEVVRHSRVLSAGITRPELAKRALAGETLTEEEEKFISSRIALDPMPILSGIVKVKALSSQIAKLKDAKTIQGLLKKQAPELADDVLQPLSQRLSKISDPVKVEGELNNLEKLAKQAQQVAPPAARAIPQELEPLAQEARKYKSAEEFSKAFQSEIKHGEYWHITDNPNFKVDPKLGPRDLSSLASGEMTSGKLMVTSDIGYWNAEFPSRKFAAKLDFSNVKPEDYYQVNRGFGNEFFVKDPSKVRVEKVVPIEQALKEAEQYQKVLEKNIRSKSQLTDFYNQAVRGVIREGVSARGAIPPKKGLPEARAGEVAIPSDLTEGARIGKEAERPPLLGDKPLLESISPETRAKAGIKGKVVGEGKQAKSLDSAYQGLGEDANLVKQADQKLSPTKLEPANYGLYQRFKSSVSSKWTSIREVIQDDWIRVKKLITREDVKVSDASNPYDKEILFRGKVDTRIERGREIVKGIDQDIISTAKKAGIKDAQLQDDVNRYLWGKHAPERNAKLGDGAAGITTKEANEMVKAIEASPQGKEVIRIANKVSELNKEILDILLEGGVIDKELHTLLRNTYKNHVPLQRIFAETEDIVDILVGRGFDVRGTGLMRARGSKREVADILSNVTANYEQAIMRAEKNIVDNATLKFARDNKHLELFEEIKPKAVGRTFAKEGEEGRILLERITDPSVLILRENGKPVYLKILDPKLAIALRGINRQKVDGLMRVVQSITRFYSGLATRFNPEFALPNKIRDLQEVMVYTASKGEMGATGAIKVLAEERRSYKAIYDFIRGTDSEGARLYNQMRMDGGTTGGLGLSTRKQVELDINKIRQLNRSNPRKATEFFVRRVDDWNTIFEDSTRLSVYRAALARGVSRQRAAVLAKEASVNFNKFGTGGPVINALYMFANASIQGSAKMLMAMKNPKVAGTIAVAVGTAVATTRQWNDRIDPEWRDKVSKWDKLNSLVVVLPSEEGEGIKYVAIPVSWGIKPIKVAMDFSYDLATAKGVDIAEAMESVVAAIVEGYNPIGGTDALSAFTPTVLDLPVEIGRNKAWHGSAIKPDWDKYAPNSIRYFGDLRESVTGKLFVDSTAKISELSDGRIEISPADVNYAYNTIIGGAGRAISKTINTITAIGKQEVPSSREIPFLSRFFRSIPEERIGAGAKETQDIRNILAEQSRERFNLNQVAEQAFQELKKTPKEQIVQVYQELKKENPQLVAKIDDIAKEEELGLTYADRLVKQLGVENGERAKYLATQFKKLKTKAEVVEFYLDMKKKGIISEKVDQQLEFLMSQ